MPKEFSDFLKTAYKHGRVKELKEAFEEYPVEEEWHKENAENWLKEQEETYSIEYEIGDIVFVKEYVYPDDKIGKDHLFVIIDQDNTAVPIENFGMLVSSNLNKLKFKSNKVLEKDGINHLHKDSLVKADVIYKILNEQIIFKIGIVSYDKIEEYKRSFYNSLKNENY